MPSFRTPFPSAFGISTFSTADGRYSSVNSSSLIRLHSSFKYGFSSSTVILSTPAAPLLLITLCSAVIMFSLSTTASINCSHSGLESSLLAVTLDAPAPISRNFRSLPLVRVSDFSAILSASLAVIETRVSSRYFMFGPSLGSSELLCPLLTSATPSQRLSTLLAQGRVADLPGYCALTFTLMPATFTYKLSVQVPDFEEMRLLIQPACLLCGFCSSGQRFACGFLQIPSRDGHPCRPANDSPCRARRGL